MLKNNLPIIAEDFKTTKSENSAVLEVSESKALALIDETFKAMIKLEINIQKRLKKTSHVQGLTTTGSVSPRLSWEGDVLFYIALIIPSLMVQELVFAGTSFSGLLSEFASLIQNL